jgi:hypothetical protein
MPAALERNFSVALSCPAGLCLMPPSLGAAPPDPPSAFGLVLKRRTG